MAGKKPSMFEKLWGWILGVGLNCLFVSCASSRAVSSPRRVTSNAASFSRVGIVMGGVLDGRMLEVMRSPAKMLPQASRLIGLMTEGLFSLIGERALNRGWPMETKNTTRKL